MTKESINILGEALEVQIVKTANLAMRLKTDRSRNKVLKKLTKLNDAKDELLVMYNGVI